MNEIKQYEKPSLIVRDQVNQIQALMQNALINGTHYGTVPGCGSKPTLLQPGAEKIALMFNWAADYEIDRSDLDGGHREYDVKCELVSRATGEHVGCGVGLCSTMESKYRYRRDRSGNRAENPDIADVYNTVLKMAKKRAFVDAVKSTAAASDIFTQDIEDMGPIEVAPQPAVQPADCLQPVRELFKTFCFTAGLTIEEGVRAICEDAGVERMSDITPEMVPDVLEFMEHAEAIENGRIQEQGYAAPDDGYLPEEVDF